MVVCQKVAHKSVVICQKVPHKNVNCFAISLFFSIFAANTEWPMERFIMQDLIAWKNRADRKPLILLGARQVGKTYILKEFGRREFENIAYINCDNNAMVKEMFVADYNIERILFTIGAITGVNIQAGKTLIVMDEIQELPRGLNALKYFCEDAPEYHVAVAGSLLGLTLHQGESYPVGKVNTLELFPMTFEEFLWARGFEPRMKLLQAGMWDVVKSMKTIFTQHLREYYLVGGMPEAVKKYIETNDANAVREVQNEIINAYEKDISKHAPTEQVVRINQVWNSIPSQLAKENKKFIYGVVKPGARAKDYEMAIQWLIDAGLVYKISRVKMLGLPLKIHEDISAFKLFILDCGLLGAMSKTPPALLLLPNNDNTGKGDFTENFVCSQIETLRDIPIYYYSKENSQLELDFVLQIDTHVVPVEVKAEENLQAKSLKTTLANHPGMQALRFSMNDYRKQDNITNVPLYGVRSFLREMVNS